MLPEYLAGFESLFFQLAESASAKPPPVAVDHQRFRFAGFAFEYDAKRMRGGKDWFACTFEGCAGLLNPVAAGRVADRIDLPDRCQGGNPAGCGAIAI